MKTSVETLDPVKVKLTVEVEPQRVKQAFDRAARELSSQVSLPGFRPGKAPRRLLEQRLGAGAIAQAALEQSLSDYYVEAVEEADIAPVASPEIDVEHFDETQGCAFTATVEVRPTFDPPDHTGIAVSFPDWEVADADVDEQVGNLRERFAEVDEVERAARNGDLVTLDLRVEIDGEELESARVEDALYEIGSAGVTPQLDELLVGTQAGDELTYTDPLPEGYPEHGGEEATFHVTVKDVREKSLPDLDDDFATTASAFDTLDELRADIRRSLQRRNVEQARHELRGRVLEAYLARVDIPLPPAMVEAEVEHRHGTLEQQAERLGLPVGALLDLEDPSHDEIHDQLRAQATESVKAQLVLDELARKLQVGVSSQDLEQEILRHAYTTGLPPEQVATIVRDQGSLPALVGDVARRKAIDAIVDAAEVASAPSDDLLIELGLLPDPDAQPEPDASEAAGSGAPGEHVTASGLIVPGGDPAAERKLIVP